MNKRVFLYVTGDDYAALEFENNYDAQTVYEDMMENKENHIILDDEFYCEVRIKEFDYVSDDLLGFVKSELCDYDDLKHANIYEVQVRWSEEY